jgi:hypothetical protein
MADASAGYRVMCSEKPGLTLKGQRFFSAHDAAAVTRGDADSRQA